jgi:hypothetical protein
MTLDVTWRGSPAARTGCEGVVRVMVTSTDPERIKVSAIADARIIRGSFIARSDVSD